MDTIFAENLAKVYEINNDETYELLKELKFYKTSDMNFIEFYCQAKSINQAANYKIEVVHDSTTLFDTGSLSTSGQWEEGYFYLDISEIEGGYCSVKLYFKQKALFIRGINLVLVEQIYC